MSNDNYMNKPHIYKIVNKINGKFYYGVHNGKYTDTYMGSGTILKQAYKKHGIENFSKEILLWFDTLEEAYEYEAVIVTETVINDPMCYNMKTGGKGGRGNKLSKETRQKISDKHKGKFTGENNPMFGKKPFANKTEEEIIEIGRKISEKLKGRTHSEETLQKMRKAKEYISEEARQKMSDGWKKREIVECPYCYKKSNNLGSMNRWHFNNCKLNQNKE